MPSLSNEILKLMRKPTCDRLFSIDCISVHGINNFNRLWFTYMNLLGYLFGTLIMTIFMIAVICLFIATDDKLYFLRRDFKYPSYDDKNSR